MKTVKRLFALKWKPVSESRATWTKILTDSSSDLIVVAEMTAGEAGLFGAIGWFRAHK